MFSSFLSRLVCFFLLIIPALNAAPSLHIERNALVSFFAFLDLTSQNKVEAPFFTKALFKKHQTRFPQFFTKPTKEKLYTLAQKHPIEKNFKAQSLKHLSPKDKNTLQWYLKILYPLYLKNLWSPSMQTLYFYEQELKTILAYFPKFKEAFDTIDDFYDINQRQTPLMLILYPLQKRPQNNVIRGTFSKNMLIIGALIPQNNDALWLKRQTLRNLLPTIIHEYSHIRYAQKQPLNKSLLLDEALATAFGIGFFKKITGEHPPIWYNDPLIDEVAKKIYPQLSQGKGFAFFKNGLSSF